MPTFQSDFHRGYVQSSNDFWGSLFGSNSGSNSVELPELNVTRSLNSDEPEDPNAADDFIFQVTGFIIQMIIILFFFCFCCGCIESTRQKINRVRTAPPSMGPSNSSSFTTVDGVISPTAPSSSSLQILVTNRGRNVSLPSSTTRVPFYNDKPPSYEDLFSQ